MKRLSALCAVMLIICMLCFSLRTFAADNYIVLDGFAFDVNSSGEAVIHEYRGSSTEVVIPEKLLNSDVTEIDDYAFYGKSGVTSVSFENAVHLEYIGCSAFSGTGITALNIPSWVGEVDFAAFQNCASLEEVVLGSGITTVAMQSFYNCDSLCSVTLPQNLETIEEYAFAGCEQLKYLELPASVALIEDSAFNGDDDLVLGVWYDSYAYHYAKNNGIFCVLLDGVKQGDANGDDQIGIADVTAIQRHIAEFETLEGMNLIAADVTQDGIVDILDATALQMYLAEYEIEYPVG